jgi:hypothetical protein
MDIAEWDTHTICNREIENWGSLVFVTFEKLWCSSARGKCLKRRYFGYELAQRTAHLYDEKITEWAQMISQCWILTNVETTDQCTKIARGVDLLVQCFFPLALTMTAITPNAGFQSESPISLRNTRKAHVWWPSQLLASPVALTFLKIEECAAPKLGN